MLKETILEEMLEINYQNGAMDATIRKELVWMFFPNLKQQKNALQSY